MQVAPDFHEFWQASELDRYSVREFSRRMSEYNADAKELRLDYPAAPTTLARVKHPLDALARNRRSSRIFSEVALSMKELSGILKSFYAWNGQEHRGYPAAGAMYTTEIFCIPFNVANLESRPLYYDTQTHGYTVLKHAAPSYDEAKEHLNIDIDGTPQALLLFVSFTDRVVQKYGERGGRFALLEAGAALQQLALTVAGMKGIVGVATGGVEDAYWLRVLHLEESSARLTVGYLVGK